MKKEKNEKKLISVQMPASEVEQLNTIADSSDLTLSQIVRRAIRKNILNVGIEKI